MMGKRWWEWRTPLSRRVAVGMGDVSPLLAVTGTTAAWNRQDVSSQVGSRAGKVTHGVPGVGWQQARVF